MNKLEVEKHSQLFAEVLLETQKVLKAIKPPSYFIPSRGDVVGGPPGAQEMGQGGAALLVLHPLRRVRHHDLHHH